MSGTTLYDKIWDSHIVTPETLESPALLYVDMHLIQEVSSPQAFTMLKERGLKVRRPDRTMGVIDHSTPTLPAVDGKRPYHTPATKKQVEFFLQNCRDHGIPHHGWDSPNRGIVHVTAPEMGLTRPGEVVVCGDSHTSTHGALGALAFGIGTTEVAHVLASQCLFQRKSKTMRVVVNGKLAGSATAKDLALTVMRTIGFDGGTGHVIEYRGTAIAGLSVEGRMTLCNMSIEAGARAGLIAPDQVTIDWLRGRGEFTEGPETEKRLADYLRLRSDSDAVFDREVEIDAGLVRPTISYGITPGANVAIDQPVPMPQNDKQRAALDYMQIEPGKALLGQPFKTIFIGSCTNSRIEDLRTAAAIIKGNSISTDIRMLIVPGSMQVKMQAEAEGIDEIFLSAGAEWREPGCSMCIGMNGDIASPDGLTLSTSNRNFIGRQGPAARTLLCSPETAAASAVAGVIADPRALKSVGAA